MNPAPSETTTFYGAYGAFTPLPNVFIDYAMPHLNDTEWRLLCVVTRQTLGWRRGNEGSDERKTSDWLTHSQLIARTGRSSEAVSRALNTLVRTNLVEVRNQDGELMATPAARRRNGGRLFYRLAPNAKNAAHHLAGEQTPLIKRHRQDGTTKEDQNKELPVGRKTVEKLPFEEDHDKAPNPDVRRFLRAYRRRLHRASRLAVTPEEAFPVWDRDSCIAADLLEQRDYFALLQLFDRFLERQWMKRGPVSLPLFAHWLRNGQSPTQRAALPRPQTVRHGRWMRAIQVRRRGKRT